MYMNAIQDGITAERSQSIDDYLKSRHGQKMSAAEITALTIMGTNPVIFGLPGGAILPLDQMTAVHKGDVKYFLGKNESLLPYASGAYGEVTGIPAYSLMTSGPGVIQGLVGIYNAMMEFQPTVAISGNVFYKALMDDKTRAFQKAKVVEAAKGLEINAVLVEKPQALQEIIKQAFLDSTKHPMGPVLVDIPKDVQEAETRFEYFEPVQLGDENQFNLDYNVLGELAKALSSAQRPFVVLGRGALNARQEVWELIERMRLPFGYTLKGKGILPDDHPQNYGLVGQHGATATNQAMENSDLVIMIGANGDDRAFLNPKDFTHGKRAIINPYLVNAQARLSFDYPIATDAQLATSELLKMLDGGGRHEKLRRWNESIRTSHENEPVYNPRKRGISPVDLVQKLNDYLKPDIFVSDIGEHQMHGAKHLNLNSEYYKNAELYGNTPTSKRQLFDKRILTSGTAGTMATSISYAAAAKIADPKKNVMVLIGDGGLEMHMEALWLLAANRLNVPVVVMNNGQYGQVLEWLGAYHDGRTEHAPTTIKVHGPNGTKSIPDFSGLGTIYNMHFFRAQYNNQIDSALQQFSRKRSPRILEAKVYPMGAYPMIPNGRTSSSAIIPTK